MARPPAEIFAAHRIFLSRSDDGILEFCESLVIKKEKLSAKQAVCFRESRLYQAKKFLPELFGIGLRKGNFDIPSIIPKEAAQAFIGIFCCA